MTTLPLFILALINEAYREPEFQQVTELPSIVQTPYWLYPHTKNDTDILFLLNGNSQFRNALSIND